MQSKSECLLWFHYCVGGLMYQIRKIYIEIAYQCLNSIIFTSSASGVYATSRLQYLSGHKDDNDETHNKN